MVFAAHRKELTFVERVGPGAEAAVLCSKVVTVAAPAEHSPAAQAVGSKVFSSCSVLKMWVCSVFICQRPHMELCLRCTIVQKGIVMLEGLV